MEKIIEIKIMKSITVFCGSSFGSEEIYKEQAVLLGQTLAKQNIQLVYGGANVGLMGAVADGYGTLEEFFEMITWAQLGLHKKPIAILNINGFYDDLIKLVQNMVDKGFLKQINQEMLLASDSIDELLEKMKNYRAPSVGKWISKEEV